MCKKPLILAMAIFGAVVAYAQGFPSSTSGDSNNSLGQSNSSVNCSDPLMAASSLCAGDLNSSALRGGFAGGMNSSGVPSLQQGQVLTYTDDTGRPTTREKSTKIPLPPEPLTEFQKFTASTTGMVLPIFGASLFQSVPSTFAPLDNAPVPPDYVVGPDDIVRLRVWGQVNFNANLRVDRSGDIYVPQVGSVHVAGARFSDLDESLRAAVGKIYRNFDLSVQLGDIRSIQIYVTGEARRPGAYTVSSLSSLVDALFASGGPSVQGSMRRIELRRGGAAITTFDLYRFLIDGDKSKDAKLLPGDLVFIPSVGPEIAVLGSVRRPAVYEMLPGETIADALKDAGNITSLASEARASLERNAERAGRQAMEVKLDTAGMGTMIRDGDILHVISIVSRFEKTVTLRGNTANPGRFSWHQGMRLSDLIPDKESLITRDYWWKRASLGLPAPEFQPVPALSALHQPANPIDLPLQQSMMRRQANSVEGTNTQPPNASNGQAQTAASPASSFFWDNSQSGNVNETYGQETGQPASTSAQTNQPSSQQQNAQRPNGPSGGESALAEQETETPEQINPPAPRRTVVKLSVPEIDWSYAVIERMDPATLKTTLIPFDLGKLVLQHDGSQDMELQAGDLVSVFSQADIHVPIAEQTTLVRLEGEFVHAGTYSVRPGETLRSVVERAGGLTPNAYLFGSVFTRDSARVLQQRRMDEAIHNMMLQMQRGNLALAASPLSNGQDLAGMAAAQASEQALIAQLQQIRASGRIVFSFRPDSQGTDVIPDVPLENGDIFLIPSVPSTVNAVGAIFNQNSFLYRPDARLESYLKLAGGPNPEADRKHMFLIRANGAVISRDSVKGAWGDEFYRLKLFPGDTIIVPDKSVKPSALRGFLGLSQVFSQLMFGIAAANVVF
jgi:protein involved in polysaccharide export with SLBB domain